MQILSRAPAAVLWDMDGTLVDTEPYWMEAERELVEAYGGEWPERARQGGGRVRPARLGRVHPRARRGAARAGGHRRASARRRDRPPARQHPVAAGGAAPAARAQPCRRAVRAGDDVVAADGRPDRRRPAARLVRRRDHRRRGAERARQAEPDAVSDGGRAVRRRPARLRGDRGLPHRRALGAFALGAACSACPTCARSTGCAG